MSTSFEDIQMRLASLGSTVAPLADNSGVVNAQKAAGPATLLLGRGEPPKQTSAMGRFAAICAALDKAPPQPCGSSLMASSSRLLAPTVVGTGGEQKKDEFAFKKATSLLQRI